ncbi:MAG: Lrp/AsnC family transcriptional regulator, partial [Clostridia bacterium]|nr:Lrp/AsnC family transcriptional regulator [Clostridia bacterium]
MDKILNLLEDNATLTPEQLAVMCEKEVGDIKQMITKYEQDGIILGYKTMIDWDKTDREYV